MLLALALALVPISPAAAATTSGDVDASRAEAGRLAAQVDEQSDAVTAARSRLADLALAAGEALERYQLAEQALQDARADHWAQSERLAMAKEAASRSRAQLGRWAAQAYRDGGQGARYDEIVALLQAKSTADLSLRLIALGRVGRSVDAAVQAAESAERTQADAAGRAEQTAARAMELATEAEAARTESERLVGQQREQVAELDALLAQTQDAAAKAEADAARLAAASRLSPPNQVTGTVGACAGGDVTAYPNGQIPASALCPVWGAPGHLLRADAAFAFDQLAVAFARQYGRTLCVTDSYRALDSQVLLRAAKPSLAAVPGMSNHGWGKAVDLCGGVERFDTAEHQWMRLNAPLYGWFHPSWAQQGGSRPEPWHWEYAG